MKLQKKLNVVLIILVIILISVISFIGIFYQNKNKMENILPNYALGTDLNGYRRVVLTVDTSDEENTEELKNYDNYVKSANIIRNRLNSMHVNDYSVRCDESTGQIEIDLPENSQTDYILADITQKGKFEIVDASTKEVLMNNEDIDNTKVRTTSTYANTTALYMDINFTTKGAKKFKDITINYQNAVSNETTNVANETSNEVVNDTANETVNEETNTTTEEESNTKEVSLNIDGTSMMTTNFSKIIDNGVLSLTLGSASTTDDLKILQYQSSSLAAILENDAMPLKYTVTGNLFVSSTVENKDINILIVVGVVIALLMLVVLIVKYKTKGLAISLSTIGFMGLFLLILRYTNVTITIEGILAIGLVYVINYIFCVMFLNRLKRNVEKSFIDALTKFSFVMIPTLILSIVCCFAGWMPIFSLGMIMFWGLVTSVIYNFVITQILIKNLSK